MLLSLLLACASPVSTGAPVSAAPPVAAASWPADLHLVRLDGTPLPDEVIAGRPVLFVNVASRCGYTPQYEGLQRLWTTYKDRGLVVVGVPCNQFAYQEPGDAEQIESFCKLNYGVDFPLLEKQDVNGAERSPLYRHLVGDGPNIKWNFEKILVDRAGRPVARFKSSVTPDDPALLQAIDAALR